MFKVAVRQARSVEEEVHLMKHSVNASVRKTGLEIASHRMLGSRE